MFTSPSYQEVDESQTASVNVLNIVLGAGLLGKCAQPAAQMVVFVSFLLNTAKMHRFALVCFFKRREKLHI